MSISPAPTDFDTIVCLSPDQSEASKLDEPISMIRFPFWLAIPHGTQTIPPDTGCDGERLPLVFQTAGKMGEYLAVHRGGNWDVRLVNRYSMTHSIEAARQNGFDAVCIDMDADGSGGRKIGITDFLATLDSTEP